MLLADAPEAKANGSSASTRPMLESSTSFISPLLTLDLGRIGRPFSSQYSRGAWLRESRMHAHLPSLRRVLVALLAIVVLAAGQALAQGAPPAPAPADDALARVQRLDQLFATLKTATVEEEGDKAVTEIWQLWMQSGNADL